MTVKETRARVSIPLLKSVKKAYKETSRMAYTVEIDWALHKLLELAKLREV